METRAYSLLEVKSVREDAREFSGLATHPSIDRQGDSVDWRGITYRNPTVLLLHHDHKQPVGSVRFGTPTAAGTPFTATIPKIEEEGDAKRSTDFAWHAVKHKLIAAVSIGFRVLDNAVERIETGLRFLKVELVELSLVSVPAQQEAVILQVRSAQAAAGVATSPTATQQRTFKRADDQAWGALCASVMPATDDEDLAAYKAARRDVVEEMKVVREASSDGAGVRSYTQGTHDSLIAALAVSRMEIQTLGSMVRRLLGEIDQGGATAVRGLQYRGTFRTGETYSEGDFLTFDGSLFHCRGFTTLSPRDAPADWQLAVKRGKDAR